MVVALIVAGVKVAIETKKTEINLFFLNKAFSCAFFVCITGSVHVNKNI